MFDKTQLRPPEPLLVACSCLASPALGVLFAPRIAGPTPLILSPVHSDFPARVDLRSARAPLGSAPCEAGTNMPQMRRSAVADATEGGEVMRSAAAKATRRGPKGSRARTHLRTKWNCPWIKWTCPCSTRF
eukprot:scaffold21700_cov89-Isochrysis_galbana.AAC.3